MTKALYQQNFKKAKWQHKKATKTYTTIDTDLGRSVGVATAGVIKPVFGHLTFQLTTNAVQSKGYTFKTLYWPRTNGHPKHILLGFSVVFISPQNPVANDTA